MSFALPPYAAVLGATLETAEDGTPRIVMPFADAVVGRPGYLQGGAISGLMELAALAALRHALDGEGESGGGGRIKPINVTVDFLRGGRDRTTWAAGRIVRLGGRVANVDARAWQDDPDRPIASARLNYLVIRP